MGKFLGQARLRLFVLTLLLIVAAFIRIPVAQAACPANTAGLGQAAGTFTIPTAGTYRVWSRIMPNATTVANDSYTLEVDGSSCGITVGDSGSLSANNWTWVDYQNGSVANKINLTLSAGSHSYVMYGRESGVLVDRVVFAANAGCVASGFGDNCLAPPADTTPPTVSLTTPAASTTVNGTITLSANASDNVGVASVGFYIDGSGLPIAVDSTSPYSYAWVTSTVANGAHTIVAKATDTAGLVTSSSSVSVTVSNVTPDTTSPTASFTSPANGVTISGTTIFNVNASDNVGVTRVELWADGILIGTDVASPYSFSVNTVPYANTSHSFVVKAYDSAGNGPGQAALTVTINNPVTVPKAGDINGDNTVNIFDASILLSNWGKPSLARTQGDLSGDGTVNVFDASILLSNWGK